MSAYLRPWHPPASSEVKGGLKLYDPLSFSPHLTFSKSGPLSTCHYTLRIQTCTQLATCCLPRMLLYYSLWACSAALAVWSRE